MEVGANCIPCICAFSFHFSYRNVSSLSASYTSVLPLQCHYFISSMLVLSPVFIGSNATVSHTANVEPGAKLLGGSKLDFCSTLPMGWTSSSNTYLCGAPAEPVKFVDRPLTRKRDVLPVLMAPFMICVYAIGLSPGMKLFNFLHSLLPNNAPSTISSAMVYQASTLVCMFFSDFMSTLALCCMMIIIKWSLVQRITRGEQSFFKEKRMKVGVGTVVVLVLLSLYLSIIFLLTNAPIAFRRSTIILSSTQLLYFSVFHMRFKGFICIFWDLK